MSNLSFDIDVRIQSLEKGLAKASASITKFANENEKKFKNFGQNMSRIGKDLSLKVTAPILALGGLSIKAASDFEETESKFNTVFRNISADANQTAKDLQKSFGLSQTAALKLLGDTGDLLTGFGFTQESALDLSNEVNKLAVDLASFTNFSGGAEGASQALTKALLGERESIKSLGISILDADVKNRVLINSQKGLKFETERQAAAYATLQLAQEQSKNAIGDYARTNQGFANQFRLLQSRISDLSVEFGKILLPIALKITKVVSDLVTRFTSLNSSTKKIILVVAGLAAAIGPVLLAIGSLATILPTLLAGFSSLLGPVGLVIAGIVALTVIIYKNFDAIKQWVENSVNGFIRIYNESLLVRIAFERLIFHFKTLFNVGKFVFNALWTIIKTNFKNIINVLNSAGTVIEGIFTLKPSLIKKGVSDFAEGVKKNVGGAIEELSREAGLLFGKVSKDAEDAFANILSGQKEPFSFDIAEESKEKLKNNVAEAVEEGAQEGFKRTQIKGVSELETSTQAYDNPVTDLAPNIKVNKNLTGITQAIIDFNNEMDGLINNSIANTFSNLGDVIGDALSGGKLKFENIGKTLIQGFAGFLGQLGDMLIQYGTFASIKGKLDLAVKTGGVAAIAAGAGGIALGIALKAISGAIGNRAASGFGGGGTGSSAVSGSSTSSFTQSRRVDNEVVFRIQYDQLVGVLRNGGAIDNIIGG